MHGADVCTLLKGDHEKVASLIERIESTHDEGERLRLLGAVKNEIELHGRLEEEVFFPALERLLPATERGGIVRRTRKELDRTTKALELATTVAPGTHRFDEALRTLKERTRAYAEVEETRVFPKVRENLETEHMQKIGEQLNRRRLEFEHLYRGRAETSRTASEH